ncbi:MAG: nitroreductase family protein [Candidatus Omnitrophota bacterium]
MNFLDLVNKRRSCRNYSSQPVEREKIKRCLEAARLAPSACNSQPWRFIVVQDPALKDQLADAAFSGVYKMNGFAKKALVLVVVIRESSKYAAKLAGSFRGITYSLIDLGIVCEHFILQAAEEDLGTCWIGWFYTKGIRKVLNLSRRDKIDIIISMGYPDNPVDVSKTRKTIWEMAEIR